MLKAEEIKRLIEKKGISQREFAKRIGMKESGFNHILKRRKTKMTTIQKIASELGVAYYQLLESENKASEPVEPYGLTEVELLKKQLKEKNERINELKEINALLREKLNKKKKGVK